MGIRRSPKTCQIFKTVNMFWELGITTETLEGFLVSQIKSWGEFPSKNGRFNDMSYRNEQFQERIWGDPFCWEIPNGPCVTVSVFSPPFGWDSNDSICKRQTPEKGFTNVHHLHIFNLVVRSKKERILSQPPWNSMFQRQTVKLWESNSFEANLIYSWEYPKKWLHLLERQIWSLSNSVWSSDDLSQVFFGHQRTWQQMFQSKQRSIGIAGVCSHENK